MSNKFTVVNMMPNLLSGESNQDSEPNLAVNPANPLEMAATAFTPSPNVGSKNSPVYYSNDGGNTWSLKDLIAGTPVRDQTLRFATEGGELYAGVLWGGGGISAINFDILRTNDFSGATTMTVLASRKNDDQPFIQAATVPTGPDAGKDRVYVGSNDHAPANVPSTLDYSLNAGIAAPTFPTIRLEARTVSRDGFQTRPAVHINGTVYASFYAALTDGTFDVIVVRDDNWGSGGSPFNALIDPGDLKQGIRVATGVNNPFLSLFIGQQRIGGDLSIVVDPHSSANVYLCFGDLQSGNYRLRVWKSNDSGVNWTSDIRIIDNATNPALAINSHGKLGFLYQQVTGVVPNQRWQTTIEFTHDDFGSFTTHILANTPAATPVKPFLADPYLGDYLYMMTVDSTFYGVFCANNTPDPANFPQGVHYQRNANFVTKTLLATDNVTPVAVSIDPFFFKVEAGTGKVTTSIADSGNFGRVCKGGFVDELLTINNSGMGMLLISDIVSSSPDFLAPSVVSYPLKVHEGDSVDVMIRYQPLAPGPHTATITIISNDPASPHIIRVHGTCPTPRLNLVIANKGSFGKVCVGSFADEPLLLNNGGRCPLSITAIHSSSADFVVPEVLSYPLLIAPGGSMAVPIRFAPMSIGAKAAKITVDSDDPAGPKTVAVSGVAPTGKLAVTGSLCFGVVKACHPMERTLSVCNVGDCNLHILSVAFKKKNKHWKLVNNPFPATLRPGSCLGVVVRYKANEQCSRCMELVILSDDPELPVKTLEVVGSTDWCGNECRCCPEDCCDDCDKDDDDKD